MGRRDICSLSIRVEALLELKAGSHDVGPCFQPFTGLTDRRTQILNESGAPRVVNEVANLYDEDLDSVPNPLGLPATEGFENGPFVAIYVDETENSRSRSLSQMMPSVWRVTCSRRVSSAF